MAVELPTSEAAYEAFRVRSAILSRRVMFGAALTFMASALLPWQSVCFDPQPHSPGVCLVAHAWQGSAALLGWVAVLSAVALVVVLVRRLNHPGDLGALEGGLATALVVSGGLRVAAGTHSGGMWPMALAAITLGVVFFSGLNVAIHGIAVRQGDAEPGSSRGGYRMPMWIAPLVVALTIGLTAIPYQASDLGRWGGPLRGDMGGGGGSGEGMPGPVGRSILFDFPVVLDNQGQLPLHVDRIRFAWIQPGLHVDAFYASRTYDRDVEPCSRIGATRFAVPARQSRCLFPPAGLTVRPAGDTNQWLVGIAMSSSRPGVYRFSGILVDYHVGLLHYRSYQSLAGFLCANAHWKTTCRHVGF